jgi:hypothetical protein
MLQANQQAKNEKRKTKNEKRKTKNEKRKTKNEKRKTKNEHGINFEGSNVPNPSFALRFVSTSESALGRPNGSALLTIA